MLSQLKCHCKISSNNTSLWTKTHFAFKQFFMKKITPL